MPATYEDLATDIDRVAKDIARDYVDVDWEDVRQQLALFVLEHGKSIKLVDDGGNPRWLLKRVAQSYCKKERTKHLALSVQYAYKPSDVKLILETAWANTPDVSYVPDDARSPLSKTFTIFDPADNYRIESIDPFHEVDFTEVSSDIKAAMKRVKIEYREAIFDRYVLGKVPDNASWERKKLNLAINDLTHKLNAYKGGWEDPKMRKAHSNAYARAHITNTYE